MQEIIDFLKTDNFLIFVAAIIIIMFIFLIILFIKVNILNKRYQNFIKKFSNGDNIEEELKNYIYKVERIEKQNLKIAQACKNLDDDMSRCIQKIGVVRYSAFKDTGSDLSFALALLDEQNDGVVLNGIYSREMSNIYAKPIEDGKSKYTLSEQEDEAIQRAMDSNGFHKIR